MVMVKVFQIEEKVFQNDNTSKLCFKQYASFAKNKLQNSFFKRPLSTLAMIEIFIDRLSKVTLRFCLGCI
ncbi:hypothetical protein T4B_8192 [Trichinella pseudospiralis]|uniref:Uncharacterized protein n=1 Tax=Trichinella pseudospiralis TaxID=6337 RepID=A0A0V1IRY0_TRIPS|nr:hypothetical protein T4B_8192 [Trichinella pseudospiralis]